MLRHRIRQGARRFRTLAELGAIAGLDGQENELAALLATISPFCDLLPRRVRNDGASLRAPRGVDAPNRDVIGHWTKRLEASPQSIKRW